MKTTLKNFARYSKWLAPLKPVYRAIVHSWQDLKARPLLKANAQLKDRHLGERCFLLATGRTLRDLDLRVFKEEFIFGCNRLYENKTLKEADCNYYVNATSMHNLWGNKAVPEGSPIVYYRLIEEALGEHTEMILDLSNHDFVQEQGFFKGKAVHYIGKRGPTGTKGPFHTDLTERIDFTDGVAYLMILLALYMGFKEIYLLGFGWTYQPVEPGHFYDSDEDLAGLDWEAYSKQTIPPQHAIIKELAEAHGAKLINVTPSGHESPVYEPITLEEMKARLKKL
ncbi:MAG: hypothetical protein RRB13_08335 [bacterium]|nr:hypothetical protein [bacterium]